MLGREAVFETSSDERARNWKVKIGETSQTRRNLKNRRTLITSPYKIGEPLPSSLTLTTYTYHLPLPSSLTLIPYPDHLPLPSSLTLTTYPYPSNNLHPHPLPLPLPLSLFLHFRWALQISNNLHPYPLPLPFLTLIPYLYPSLPLSLTLHFRWALRILRIVEISLVGRWKLFQSQWQTCRVSTPNPNLESLPLTLTITIAMTHA